MKTCVDPVVLDLPSDASVLGVVRAAVRALADDGRRVRLDAREVGEVQVALQEACTNVIRHAHKGDAAKRLVVEFVPHDDALEILVKDRGAPFELAVPRDDPAETLAEGGYGIRIMRSWMDEVSVSRENGGNVLRMVRRYRAGARAADVDAG
jgi:serine/threonine-protein kinase RsbW